MVFVQNIESDLCDRFEDSTHLLFIQMGYIFKEQEMRKKNSRNNTHIKKRERNENVGR